MTTILRAGLLTLALAAAPAAAIAEEPGRADTEPLAHEEYLVVLEQMSTASNATTSHLGPASTAAEVAQAFAQMVDLAEVDQVRLIGLIAEPCYEAAHEEMLAYREATLVRMRAALPEFVEAETVQDIGGMVDAIDADLRANHPAAYFDSPDSAAGYDGSWRNILANLATCPIDVPPNMQRFEYPAEGVAITLTRTWTEIPRSEISSDAVIGGYYSDVGVCHVARGPADGVETAAEILEVLLPTSFWAKVAPDYETATVTTTAGEAVQATFNEQNADPVATIRNAVYLVPRGEWVDLVQCLAVEGRHEAPTDDWLSIAEALEFIPPQV